jgi:hypothetical protein
MDHDGDHTNGVERWSTPEHPGAGHITEQQRLLGGITDLHPDEAESLAAQLEKAQRTIKWQAESVVSTQWSNEQMSAKLEALTRQRDAYRGERDDLSALLEWIHPDEDPHDHLDTDQCRSTKRREWTGPLGNQQWSVTYCAGRQGHPGAHTGGPAGQRETWSADDDQRDAIIHHQV